jgi:hypothetical protein
VSSGNPSPTTLHSLGGSRSMARAALSHARRRGDFAQHLKGSTCARAHLAHTRTPAIGAVDVLEEFRRQRCSSPDDRPHRIQSRTRENASVRNLSDQLRNRRMQIGAVSARAHPPRSADNAAEQV